VRHFAKRWDLKKRHKLVNEETSAQSRGDMGEGIERNMTKSFVFYLKFVTFRLYQTGQQHTTT
jgi:hypothetical protein